MVQYLKRNWLCSLENDMTWDDIWRFWLNTRKSQNLHFNELLLTKVYNAWAKNYRGVMRPHTKDRHELRKKNDLQFYRWYEEFGEVHQSTTKILKFALWDTFLFKVYNFWAKKLQRSYVSWHWRVMQYLRKTDWWFEKWHKEFG